MFKNKTRAQLSRYLIVILILLIPINIFGYNLFFVGTKKGSEETVPIHIKSGTSLAALTEELQAKEVIDAPKTFYLWGRLTGYSTSIQEGIYYLPKHLNVISALNQLKTSQHIRITIPEGYTVPDIAKLIAGKTNVSEASFLEAAKKYAPYPYMEEALKNPNVKYATEGFLFPDTYDFSKNQSPEDMMKIMVDNFNEKLTPQMREEAAAKGLSIYKLVTLASLVEKEAKYQEDAPQIAQVFYKRLAINMPLQSDATIQYVMPNHKEEFTLEDTKYDSPYNTYLHYGLPPGPIGNPGIGAIEAVLNPAATDYLYFVADNDGHNHYSRTYEEHEATIKKIYKD